MKVALDATPLTESTGGIRRYTQELQRALAEAFPEDRFELISQASQSGRWWSYGLPMALRRDRVDVFHGTDFAVPYAPLRPSVMTLHDLSPWKGFPASDRVRHRTPWLLRLRLPTLVITPTEAIRREAMERFAYPADRLIAAPEAPARAFRAADRDPAAPLFLLHVGTLGHRKNVDLAIAAWREVRRSHPSLELVVAGRGELPEEPGLRVVGAVSDEQLSRLYASAAALVFPSFYEGFGLPVVEAMKCRCPVVASTDPALVEVAGGAALHCDARDVAAWVSAIRHVLSDPEPMREAGERRAAEFSWARTAKLTYEVYQEARRRFGR